MYSISQERQDPEESEDKRESDNADEKSDEGSVRVSSPVQDWVDVAIP